MAVHYFGFPQQLRETRAICDRHALQLIEDCAHILPGIADGQAVGTYGDACVFSWRKLLPINDGATLYLKNPRYRLQPYRAHHAPIASTANAGVSDEVPTQT